MRGRGHSVTASRTTKISWSRGGGDRDVIENTRLQNHKQLNLRVIIEIIKSRIIEQHPPK